MITLISFDIEVRNLLLTTPSFSTGWRLFEISNYEFSRTIFRAGHIINIAIDIVIIRSIFSLNEVESIDSKSSTLK